MLGLIIGLYGLRVGSQGQYFKSRLKRGFEVWVVKTRPITSEVPVFACSRPLGL